MKKILFTMLFVASYLSGFSQNDNDDYTISKRSQVAKVPYGKNIFAFNPVHLIASDFVGVGFSYERLANDYLGLQIPVMIGINSNYFNIGLEAKLYPTKNTGPVKYAIAPTIMFGIGEAKYNDYVYDPILGYSVAKAVTEPATHFGFLLNQTLNVTIARQFYIGLDGGLGLNYYDEKSKNRNNNNNSNNTTNLSFLAQLHIGLGYRF